MAKKKAAPKKKAATKTSAARKEATPLSATRARTLFGQINGLLAGNGVDGKVHEIHLAASSTGDCPSPKRWRRVCFRNANGEIECEDRCV
jgi:hypothetical protein